jgi:hypothetical protein
MAMGLQMTPIKVNRTPQTPKNLEFVTNQLVAHI